jgi:hypothetical protein
VKGPGWLSFIHLKFLFQARLQRGNVHLKQAQLNEAKADFEKVVRVCQWFFGTPFIFHCTHNVTYNNDFKPVVCELALACKLTLTSLQNMCSSSLKI